MQTLKKIPGMALESETIRGSFYVSTAGQPNPGFNIMEIWKDVKGYEGLYQVSNLGKVKSLKKIITTKKGWFLPKKECVLKYKKGNHGYIRVMLYKNKKGISFGVHKLVIIAFIPNPENKPEPNHKNGIKTDNRVVNLEWVTKSENAIHSYKMGLQKPLRGSDVKTSNVTNSEVLEIRRKYKWNVYTMEMLAKEYNMSRSGIFYIVKRLTWTHI